MWGHNGVIMSLTVSRKVTAFWEFPEPVKVGRHLVKSVYHSLVNGKSFLGVTVYAGGGHYMKEPLSFLDGLTLPDCFSEAFESMRAAVHRP